MWFAFVAWRAKFSVTYPKLSFVFSEWWKKHNQLPPVDWFENVYTPAVPDNPAEFEVRREFMIFYYEQWLPKTTGGTLAYQHNQEFKFFKMPIQPCKIPGEGKVPYISQESEAFGLISIKNAYAKWEHILPKKCEDADWEAPKHDKDNADTHKCYDTLWSDGRNGQLKGGGWAPAAYDALTAYINKIKKFRQDDKAAKWATNKAFLTLVRAKHNITADKPDNKRRRQSKAATRVYNDVAELSDVAFSDDNEEEDE